MLTRVVAAALPTISELSIGPTPSPADREKGMTPLTPDESTALIFRHAVPLKDELQLLNKAMLLARNILVTPEPVAQDICAATSFDHSAYQVLIMCINVGAKQFAHETAEPNIKNKVDEIIDLCKPFLQAAGRLQSADHSPICSQDSYGHYSAAYPQLDIQQ